VLEVIRDLHCFLREYKVIVAVDAHEIFDYCFPINPTDEQGEINSEELAESQAALNQLFKPSPNKPPVILLPEYRDELRGLMDNIERQSGPVYDSAEMIGKLIRAGNLEEITEEEGAELESVVSNSFQFLLTVLMGIHSLGVTRMKEAYDKGLTPILEAIEPEDRDYFSGIWDKYVRTELYDVIFQALEADSAASSNLTARASSEHANRYDASAIDRLIYLNSEVERASDKKFLKHKYLFLYVSTTTKSRRVFELPAVKAALPKISERRYSFWRTRHQVLAYVIYRNRDADPRENALKTVTALRSLNVLLRKVRDFEKVFKREADNCKECILEGKTPASCSISNYCHEVSVTANKIKEKREEVKNWGLFQQISSYAYLREAAGHKLKLGHGVYLQLFADLLENRSLKDIALERMYQGHLWITRASDWTLLTSRIREGFDPTKELDLRSEKDQITGIDQHLPSKPRFKSAEYKEILDLILGFYRQPERLDLFDNAYHNFLALESTSRQDQDEYDLLRSYLYMAFGSENNIHSYVKEILLPKTVKGVGDDARRESLYVLCWSARRAGLYREAHDYAQQGAKQYPGDPRFHHGSALNIYSWSLKQPEDCLYGVTDAISQSLRALELYRRHELENRELIAACHNNIAYFLAIDAKTGAGYDKQGRIHRFEQAREHLGKLKSVIDKETGWHPLHPEFFHTEAFVEYQLAIYYWLTGERTKEQLLEQLKGARNDIAAAIEAYNRSRYRQLRDEIDGFYHKIDLGGH
jgi:hypothetical protein